MSDKPPTATVFDMSGQLITQTLTAGSDSGGQPPIASPPGGPQDPGMEARVARLEDDMKEVRSALGRMEPMLSRMDGFLQGTLPTLAKSAEVTGLNGKADGIERRLTLAESAINTRMPTWWQMPAVMAATVVFLIALVTSLFKVGQWLGVLR